MLPLSGEEGGEEEGEKNRAFSCESFIIIGDLGRERVVNFYKVAAKRPNTRTTSQGNNEFLASLL